MMLILWYIHVSCVDKILQRIGNTEVFYFGDDTFLCGIYCCENHWNKSHRIGNEVYNSQNFVLAGNENIIKKKTDKKGRFLQ